MNKLLVATNNQNKLKEIRNIIGDIFDIISLKDAGIVSDPEETGTTFEENARIKAISGMKLSGLPCMADDSGLEVESLGDAPGIYSARYSGVHGNDTENNKLLLYNMRNKQNRNAKYVCVICIVFPDGRELTETGECHGEIMTEPRGYNGFGYDPIFLCPQYNKTYAELTATEKNAISHRAMALKKIRKIIGENHDI